MASTATTLLVLGVVALLGGGGMVLFAEADQNDNEERPLSDSDENRADRNEQLYTAGWIVAGIGALLAVMGGVAAASRSA